MYGASREECFTFSQPVRPKSVAKAEGEVVPIIGPG